MEHTEGASSARVVPDRVTLHHRISDDGGEGVETSSAASEPLTDRSRSEEPSEQEAPSGAPSEPAPSSEPEAAQEPRPERMTHVASQKPPKSRFKRVVGSLLAKYDRLVTDHWTYELLGAFVCAGTLISICAILFAFSNTPTVHIMSNITLNTAISILATVSRAAAGLIAASVIAQQKWLRFHEKSRSLIEVVLYDDAARGPLGSLYLLITMHLGFVTAFAAFAVVLTIGFEPFVQQSVKYPLRDQAISSAVPPFLSLMQNFTSRPHQVSNWTVDVNAAATQALFADTVGQLRPNCGGTTCDWPSYGSIAVCSSCEDAMNDVTVEPKHDGVLHDYLINDYINLLSIADINFNSVNGEMYMTKISNTTYTISLGQGSPAIFNLTTIANLDAHFGGDTSLSIDHSITHPETILWNLHGEEGEPWIIGESRFLWRNNTINGVTGPLRAFGYLELAVSSDGSRLVPTAAERCVISLCARQYSSTFTNGTLSSRVIDQSWGTVKGDPSLNWSTTLNGTYFHSDSQDGNFSEIWASILTPLFNLNGTVLRANDTAGYSNFTNRSDPGADVLEFISDIRTKTTNIAQGLSNFIQQNGDGEIRGQAYVSKPFVEVRWAWLSFPITLVVIIFVTLAVTMWQTKHHRIPIWRSSPFALLFNFRDPGEMTALNGRGNEAGTARVVTASGLEERALKIGDGYVVAKGNEEKQAANSNNL
ncbi:hypothetical protein H2200_008324 [Cladophialophora chaetospira]|uniref:Uncharacterized protein n=1 Tax=Cladophialophora chaetospira TaxID=386627 RepID=A0AA38X618_9EURO|nr:hypothetical protein H2200_008324 [Cladophialophora chaetospira]